MPTVPPPIAFIPSDMESFTSPQGLALLEDNKAAYREARGRDRRNVVLSVYRQLVLLTRVRDKQKKRKLRKVSSFSCVLRAAGTDIAQQCFTWFQNHAGHRKHAKEHRRRSWHWCSVVRAKRKDELEELVRVASNGARPGSKAYFSK